MSLRNIILTPPVYFIATILAFREIYLGEDKKKLEEEAYTSGRWMEVFAIMFYSGGFWGVILLVN